jgi:hypothetical protein
MLRAGGRRSWARGGCGGSTGFGGESAALSPVLLFTVRGTFRSGVLAGGLNITGVHKNVYPSI